MNFWHKIIDTFSLVRQLNSFRNAFRGLAYVFYKEHNMHIHVLSAVLVVVLGYYLVLSYLEWCALVLAIGLVMVTETLNTAIELLTDLVQPNFNPIAGKIKDIAAGAVTLAAITALIIGGIIFLPKLYLLF